MAAPDALTICTVAFHSKRWLELNRRLTARLNPQLTFRWVVTENSPPDSSDTVDPHDRWLTIVPGAAQKKRPYASGSYHHGEGMNRLRDQIRTPYALFLDPDFFIIRRCWIPDVIEHMQRHGISILGAPWHPRWYLKPRYFPCVHCMFVDLSKIPPDHLDFRPDYPAIPGYRDRDEEGVKIRAGAVRRTVTSLDPLQLHKRQFIGTSRDVSWRIHARFAADPTVRSECLQPVFRARRGRIARWVDSVLPDQWSFVPKRPHYFTQVGFRERGLPDLNGRGWEEFLWRDRPFGFHVRSQRKPTSHDPGQGRLRLAEELTEFFSARPG